VTEGGKQPGEIRLGASGGKVRGRSAPRKPEESGKYLENMLLNLIAIGLCDHAANCGLKVAARVSATIPASRTPGLNNPK
jgi:hypothetical protein